MTFQHAVHTRIDDNFALVFHRFNLLIFISLLCAVIAVEIKVVFMQKFPLIKSRKLQRCNALLWPTSFIFFVKH